MNKIGWTISFHNFRVIHLTSHRTMPSDSRHPENSFGRTRSAIIHKFYILDQITCGAPMLASIKLPVWISEIEVRQTKKNMIKFRASRMPYDDTCDEMIIIHIESNRNCARAPIHSFKWNWADKCRHRECAQHPHSTHDQFKICTSPLNCYNYCPLLFRGNGQNTAVACTDCVHRYRRRTCITH